MMRAIPWNAIMMVEIAVDHVLLKTIAMIVNALIILQTLEVGTILLQMVFAMTKPILFNASMMVLTAADLLSTQLNVQTALAMVS